MSKLKHPKSPTLAAVREKWSRPTRRRALPDMIFDYPHGVRAPVFCWLWVNHAELSEMLGSARLCPTWASVASIMASEGVKGRYGVPPTGDAVRRVWGRVCREIEAERRAEEAARKAVSPAPAPGLRGKAADLPQPAASPSPASRSHPPACHPSPAPLGGAGTAGGLHPDAVRLRAIINQRSGR